MIYIYRKSPDDPIKLRFFSKKPDHWFYRIGPNGADIGPYHSAGEARGAAHECPNCEGGGCTSCLPD